MNRYFLKNLFAVSIVLLFTNGSFAQTDFSFAFFTDVHLNNGVGQAHKGLQKALNSAGNTDIDFILTGGDNVDADVLNESRRDEAIKLYSDFKGMLQASGKPFYVTMGNHDRFWAKADSNVSLNNDGMFRQFFGKSYYSFDHNGWKFFVLNSLQTQDSVYPVINKQQMEWLKSELDLTPQSTPIIISTHVPFLSVYYPVTKGNYTNTDIVKNQFEVLQLFAKHNLKLVLQGHMHMYEEIDIPNKKFVTAGAVSAAWWGGAYFGTEEGYLQVNIKGNNVECKYIDYGWEILKY